MLSRNFVARILVTVSAIVILLQVAMGYYLIHKESSNAFQTMENRIHELNRELKFSLVESIWNLDAEWSSQFVSDRMGFPPFVAAKFVGMEQKTLFTLIKDAEKILPSDKIPEHTFVIQDSLVHESETIAHYSLYFSDASIRTQIKKSIFEFVLGNSLIAMIIILVLWFSMWSMVEKSIDKTTASLENIAAGEGDLTQRLSIERQDQIGRLAHWFNAFVERLQTQIRSIAENTQKLFTSSATLQNSARQIGERSRKMRDNLARVSVATSHSSKEISSISTSVKEMSGALKQVSTSVEQMKNAIQVVTQSTREDAKLADQANLLAESAKVVLDRLGHSATEIGKMVDVIQDIADQTNLLALNATIEASSAGEAGKGFAVVANEVKELARQTSKATEEVSSQVRSIQESSEQSATVLNEIAQSIFHIHEGTNRIVVSLENQHGNIVDVNKNLNIISTSAQGIVGNVSSSSSQLESVANNVQTVNQMANELFEKVEFIQSESSSIAGLSNSLQAIIKQFRT